MTAISLLPLLILLLLILGSGALGLVFIILFNIGVLFGSSFYVFANDTEWRVEIPTEQSND